MFIRVWLLSNLLVSSLSVSAGELWDKKPLTRTQLMIQTHLSRIASFLYGDGASARSQVMRELGGFANSAELKSKLETLSPEELENLARDGYHSALHRAVRGVLVIKDLVANLPIDVGYPPDLYDHTVVEDEYTIPLPKSSLAWDSTILDKLLSMADFKKYPNFQTDLERILEMEAVLGQENEEAVGAALEEIHREHHPETCELQVIKSVSK